MTNQCRKGTYFSIYCYREWQPGRTAQIEAHIINHCRKGSSFRNCLHFLDTSSIIRPNMLLSSLFANTLFNSDKRHSLQPQDCIPVAIAIDRSLDSRQEYKNALNWTAVCIPVIQSALNPLKPNQPNNQKTNQGRSPAQALDGARLNNI
jgi:hypothetical protein